MRRLVGPEKNVGGLESAMVTDLVCSRLLQTDLGVKRVYVSYVYVSGPDGLQNESYSRVWCA